MFLLRHHLFDVGLQKHTAARDKVPSDGLHELWLHDSALVVPLLEVGVWVLDRHERKVALRALSCGNAVFRRARAIGNEEHTAEGHTTALVMTFSPSFRSPKDNSTVNY